MARIARYDHCRCGKIRKVAAANNPGGSSFPGMFYAQWDLDDVADSGVVCGAPGPPTNVYSREMDISINFQQGYHGLGTQLCTNGGDTFWNGIPDLARATYDDALGIWYGEMDDYSLVGEPDYPHRLCFEIWLTPSGNQPAWNYYIKNTEGTKLTPDFGISTNANLGVGRWNSPLYMSTDVECQIEGPLSGYLGVLPKFLWQGPAQYSVTVEDPFVTDFDSYSGTFLLVEQCTTQRNDCPPCLVNPEGNPSLQCTVLRDNVCSVNWAQTSFAYGPHACCKCCEAGELAQITGSPSITPNVFFVFGGPPFNPVLGTKQARYTGTPNRFGTTTLSYTATGSDYPGGWSKPPTITMTFAGFYDA